MQPVLGDNSFDAAGADCPAALPQLLRDDLRGGVGVEKAVSDDLADHLGRSPIVRLGTAFLAVQCNRAGLLEGGAELKVTLLAVTEPGRSLERSKFFTLPLDEHQHLVCDLIILANVQDPARPDQRLIRRIELCHLCFLRKGSRPLGPRGTSLQEPC